MNLVFDLVNYKRLEVSGSISVEGYAGRHLAGYVCVIMLPVDFVLFKDADHWEEEATFGEGSTDDGGLM